MRLIDADLLKKNIAKWLQGGDPQETQMVKLDDIAVSVVMEIEEQPTAYNVEKVVEELEEMQVKAEKDMQLSDNVAEANAYGGMMLAYGLAIPIVEKGGVE